MLNYKPISIQDKKSFDQIVMPLNSQICAHSFSDLFMWKFVYNTEMCIEDGFVFIKQQFSQFPCFFAPIGTGDFKEAIEKIKQTAKELNAPFKLCVVNKEQKQEIEKLDLGFEFIENRDNEDYIYTSESLITLAGKKLHSKRNFINRFKQAYDGRWSYEDMTNDNKREMFAFHIKWCKINDNLTNDEIKGETGALATLMKNSDTLDAKGGILRLDNEIIAITIGSKPTEEMFIVHIEKADHRIAGAYQMINNQFAIHNFETSKYINREEDLGSEGLRKAKLSYNPIFLGENYTAIYNGG